MFDFNKNQGVDFGKSRPSRKRKAIRTTSKNPHAVALGKLGGLKGGIRRAKKLTPMERSLIASKAAQARWRKK